MLNIFMPKYGTDICWHTRSEHAGYITQGMLNYAEVNTSLTTSFYLGHNQFCDNAYLWVTTFPPSKQHTAVSHCTSDAQLTLFSSTLMVLTNTLLGSVPGTCFCGGIMKLKHWCRIPQWQSGYGYNRITANHWLMGSKLEALLTHSQLRPHKQKNGHHCKRIILAGFIALMNHSYKPFDGILLIVQWRPILPQYITTCNSVNLWVPL